MSVLYHCLSLSCDLFTGETVSGLEGFRVWVLLFELPQCLAQSFSEHFLKLVDEARCWAAFWQDFLSRMALVGHVFFPLNTAHRLCVTALIVTFDLSQRPRSSFTLFVCFETGSHGSWAGNWGQPWILDPSSLECWDYRVRVCMVLGIKPKAPSMLDTYFIRRATSLAPLSLFSK